STWAPAADSSSAFHAAAAAFPHTSARLPSSDRNTGRRDSARIRGLVSSGWRNESALRRRVIGAAPTCDLSPWNFVSCASPFRSVAAHFDRANAVPPLRPAVGTGENGSRRSPTLSRWAGSPEDV